MSDEETPTCMACHFKTRDKSGAICTFGQWHRIPKDRLDLDVCEHYVFWDDLLPDYEGVRPLRSGETRAVFINGKK